MQRAAALKQYYSTPIAQSGTVLSHCEVPPATFNYENFIALFADNRELDATRRFRRPLRL
jgi:hypothetical protein